MVVDEGVSGLRVRDGGQGSHAAVHKDPEGDVVTLEDGRLHSDHVAQEVDVGRSRRLPVL